MKPELGEYIYQPYGVSWDKLSRKKIEKVTPKYAYTENGEKYQRVEGEETEVRKISKESGRASWGAVNFAYLETEEILKKYKKQILLQKISYASFDNLELDELVLINKILEGKK